MLRQHFTVIFPTHKIGSAGIWMCSPHFNLSLFESIMYFIFLILTKQSNRIAMMYLRLVIVTFKAVEKSEMVWLLNHSNKGQHCLVLFYSLLNNNNSSFTIFISSQSNWRVRWEKHQKYWNNYANIWNNDLQVTVI